MSPRKARDFWRGIAVGVEDTTEYPGYRYVFCKTFAEFDKLMQEEAGSDWRQTEWARYLARGDGESSLDISIERVNRDKMSPANVVNPYVAVRNNYEFIAKQLIQEGVTDVETLYDLIRRHTTSYRTFTGTELYTYKPTKQLLTELVRKYSTRTRRPTRVTPTYIIRALIEHYAQEGRSLRDIAYKLNKNEGIRLSHERIREIAATNSEIAGG
jgi:hypothetical protein